GDREVSTRVHADHLGLVGTQSRRDIQRNNEGTAVLAGAVVRVDESRRLLIHTIKRFIEAGAKKGVDDYIGVVRLKIHAVVFVPLLKAGDLLERQFRRRRLELVVIGYLLDDLK